jgi:phenylalanyl-tRNA synthetase alpha chain
MMIQLTLAQAQRIRELGEVVDDSLVFASEEQRDEFFTKIVSKLVKSNRKKIQQMAQFPERNPIAVLENNLAQALVAEGFIEVKTPQMISAAALEKMGITESHPLHEQVFWINQKKCLRPMLAPNLYHYMRQLKRNVPKSLKIFEIGSCFRKESHGSNHLEEFTMLNLVDVNSESDAMERLKKHIGTVMDTLQLDYELVVTGSEVYGQTLDVEVGGIEIASGAIGPLPMDEAHGINEPWAGVGFGLERICMLQQREQNIRSVGRSLSYLNGARLDI